MPLDRRPQPSPEHVESARVAGLRYVTDQLPGIRRTKTDSGFIYIGPDRHVVDDEETLARIRALVIPPAWTDVWICPNPLGHIQVTARDAKGRKQYRYHPRYREVRDESKFERLLGFSRIVPMIRRRVEADLRRRGLPREKVLATIVRLLEKTSIRVGNDEYVRQNKSYGLTTLRNRHVRVAGPTLRFSFRGKSGKVHTVKVTDARVARVVRHCQALPGEELFQYVGESGVRQTIDSGDINDYLREISGSDISAKDFRTWAGTIIAANALARIGTGKTKRERHAAVLTALDEVAEKLGNTRTVCRKYYVHPALFQAYERGLTLSTAPAHRMTGHALLKRLAAA